MRDGIGKEEVLECAKLKGSREKYVWGLKMIAMSMKKTRSKRIETEHRITNDHQVSLLNKANNMYGKKYSRIFPVVLL